MRQRLTVAFVSLALLVAVVTGAIRMDALSDMARTAELNALTHDAKFVATLVDDLAGQGMPVTTAMLKPYLPDETELTVEQRGRAPVTIEADDFDGDISPDMPPVQAEVGDVTVEIVQDASVVAERSRQNLVPLGALTIVMMLLVAIAIYLVARLMTRPFDQLAESAAALGRGRFDFVPPKSRIPEVVSIATSLETSATQLQDFLRRDREFFQHASHALRTPLTGIRLRLEELSLRDDLSPDAQGAAVRCVGDVERLDATITELLDFARSRSLVAGAEVTLLTLGAQVAQQWRDRLPDSRDVKAYVDGGADFLLTPGPVEQLLDSVLRDVADHGAGMVTLRFLGQPEHVRVTVLSGAGPGVGADRSSGRGAQMIAEVLGGRCVGDIFGGGLEILLPRR